jgi:outer membrane protein OmpA-like peptidoglycan-associated protein
MRRALAGTMLSLCFALPAHGAEGWYLSLEAGGDVVSDWEHTRTRWTWCGPEVKQAAAAFEIGWAAFGAAGFAMGQWRLELEGGYRHNDLESYVKNWKGIYVLEEGRRFDPSGELTEASLMLNVIYDVPIFERFSLSIGLGAGADFANFKLNTTWAPVDEDDWHFAYQGLAGVNYALSEVTIIFVNYRYANVSDIGFDPTPLVHLEGEDFEKQAATAGVRFALSAPAVLVAAPPAAPQPVPLEREFMVFFGFNRWSLSSQALATIQEAAGAVRQSGSVAIRVVGHADRAGSIAYNKALSLRRARSVKKALIDEGLAAAAISISGRGESEPLVQTADGVRESQNRRVHISF